MGPLHALSPSELADLLDEATPDERPALLRERFRTHVDEFCAYCWPDVFDAPFNRLHDSLLAGQLVPDWRERREKHETVRRAIAAPRGFAKSTIKTFGAPAHDIAYGRESFLVLISATHDQAIPMSEQLRAAFQDTESPFARLYGPFKVSGGVERWRVSVRGRKPVEVACKSYGTEIRGIKSIAGDRPSKFVIDDGEKRDRVRSPDQRNHWWNWLVKDVLKAGDRRGGAVVDWVGTVLHPESVLARLLRDPGWKPERWQAILSWPERSDLWEQAGRIWVDLTLGEHRRAAAYAFYLRHRAEMDRGAQVLDPTSKSIFELYEQIWAEGLASFNQEMQNDPIDPTTQIFFSQKFAKFRVDGGVAILLDPEGKPSGRRVKIADMRKVGAWDPAIGDPGGDFAALAVTGRDSFGYTFVLDCAMRRMPPSAQLATAWELSRVWGCPRFVVEANGFQQLVAEPYQRELDARKAAGQHSRLYLDLQHESENKELRIATLEPDCTNGWLLFNERIGSEVLGQFDAFPTGDHDDGPDAIERAWKEIGGRPVAMEG